MKYILNEGFEIHDRLNPILFNDDNTLKPDIRDRLIEIGKEFVDKIIEDEIPIRVYDYWLVGSSASYNYTEHSDIDLHILVDIDYDGFSPKLMRILYDYIKNSFNDKYDITIKGRDVEVYLEDINTSAITNGIYSLFKDEWVKFPSRDIYTSNYYAVEELPLYKYMLDKYYTLNDEDVQDFIDKLYLLRKEGLATDGEFSDGNLVFKQFRNDGYLQSLKDRVLSMKSRELSLESLSNK